MTIDVFLRDTSGRPIAPIADNATLPAMPPRRCEHGTLCAKCEGRAA